MPPLTCSDWSRIRDGVVSMALLALSPFTGQFPATQVPHVYLSGCSAKARKQRRTLSHRLRSIRILDDQERLSEVGRALRFGRRG